MSRGINKVIIVGHLGNEPEVRYMPDGSAVANLSVATSESWRDKNTGEPREKTEWHRVDLFGKVAEVARDYLHKGSQVYIEGKLETRKWQDQQGQDRYTTSIVVRGFNGTMQMLGSNPNGGQGQAAPQQQRPQQQAPQQQGGYGAAKRGQHVPQQQAPQYDEPPMDFDDDIPFFDPYHRAGRLWQCC